MSGGGGVRGVVASIHVSPARGLAMKSVDSVVAVAGAGLEGDRYFGSRHRHVSVQSSDDLAEAADQLGAAIDAGSTRRNVTVHGVELPTRPGERLTIGGVELEVVRIAAPCKLLDDVIGAGARIALRRRAGTIFRVLSSGTIALGDPVSVSSGAADGRP